MIPFDSLSSSKKSTVFDLVKQYSSAGILLNQKNILNLLTIACTDKELDVIINELLTSGLITCHGKMLYWAANTEGRDVKAMRMPSSKKIEKVAKVLKIISKISVIKFIGITGSNTFDEAGSEDDVDIFVVVKHDTLYVSRLLILLITIIFGVFKMSNSKHSKDRICTNVILEEGSLDVPYPKRNLFSAREMAQIKTFYDNGGVLEKIKNVNSSWCKNLLPNFQYFPNKKNDITLEHEMSSWTMIALLNGILGFLQLWYMKSKVTNELLSRSQLWLHPNTRRELV